MQSYRISAPASGWRRLGPSAALAAASLAFLLGAPAALGAPNHRSSGPLATGLQACGSSALTTCRAAPPGPVPVPQCTTTTPATADSLPSDASQLAQLIEDVPCPTTGRASYDTLDTGGGQMDALDPIEDPAGGYLGVYHTPFGSPAGATAAKFRISLAHSDDLIHWSPIRVLDRSGAAMPTLRQVPGTHGYLLAYQKAQTPTQTQLRVRYYPSLGALLAGNFSAQRDLPRLFSPYSNGTPNVLSVVWHGSILRSVIKLGFHYNDSPRGLPGPDREALGTLRGFRQWTAHTDPSVDELLLHDGFHGSHGDRRQFSFDGHRWRIYEAQTSLGNYATWHIVLLDPASGHTYPLTIATDQGAFSTSFGNPTAQVERAPTGTGQVLVVTMFVFRTGKAETNTGELIYYQPL